MSDTKRYEPYKASTLDTCAHIAYEATRTFRVSLGDDSRLRWERLSPDEKEPVMLMVHNVLYGWGSAERRHKTWLRAMKSSGWSYGLAVDSIVDKTHPNMVNWSSLTKRERIINTLFADVVRSVANALEPLVLRSPDSEDADPPTNEDLE